MPVKNLISIGDLTREDVERVFEITHELKTRLRQRMNSLILKRYTMALLFEKPSLRTRCTFEIGMFQLGGFSVYLAPTDVGMGKRESVHDVAKNLERWVNLIVARTFAHDTVVELAVHAETIPVINALTDLEHPCQALTDFFTMKEKRGSLDNVHLAFIGDGNNVCNSLMLLTALMGTRMTIACPEGFDPSESIAQKAHEIAAQSGASIKITRDPVEAVKQADFIYTDVWASMGQESEAEERRKIFQPYRVNIELVKKAPPTALVMHDMPAHRGEEITDEVLDSHQAIAFDQAENRLHTQKGIMVFLCNGI